VPATYIELADAYAKSESGIGELTATCPHCGTLVAFECIASLQFGHNRPKVFNEEVAFSSELGRCRACLYMVIGVLSLTQSQVRTRHLLWPTVDWPDHAPSGLEPNIRKSYDEARAVLTRSPSAAAVLARRCVQHVIRQKMGIEKNRLVDEIGEAIRQPILTTGTKNALDHVRHIGNIGAHPEADASATIVEVTKEEAAYTLEVLELLFEDLYMTPMKIDAMKVRLATKRK